MSQVAISGNASGTGTLTIASPNTNSNYTLTLPTATTTIVGTDATQTLTNKTIQGGAITSGTAVASTSGTSIDFTSIPSWVKRITVMFSGVSLSGSSAYLIQIGTSGGIQNTGYTASSYNIATAGGGGSNSTVGFSIESGAADRALSGNFLLNNITSGIWVASHTMGCGVALTGLVCFGGGSKNLSGTLDRVRITTVNGTDTFDAGSVNIMFEG